MKGFRLKSKVQLPLFAATILIVLACGFFILQQEENHIKDEMSLLSEEMGNQLRLAIHGQSEKLAAALDLIVRDPKLIEALGHPDRLSLLQLTRPLFKQLRQKYLVTHFYVHSPDRVNILRVHQPDRYGDLIDRITARQAATSRAISSGIEVGPLGTFTLRVVKPVIVDHRIIAYLELGEEIDSIIQQLRHDLKQELTVLIDKRYMNKDNWLTGMTLLGRTESWDRFKHLAVLSHTFAILPKTLNSYLNKSLDSLRQAPFRIAIGNRKFYNFLLPIMDAGNRQIGDILTSIDITEKIAIMQTGIMKMALLIGAMSLLLFCFFHLVLGKTETRLQKLFATQTATGKKLANAQRLAHIGNVSWDRDLYIKDMSQEASMILGLTQDNGSVYDKIQFLDLVHPDDKKAFGAFIQQVDKSGRVSTLTHRIQQTDGTSRILLNHSEPLFDDNNLITGYQASIQDVTEQSRNQKRASHFAHILKHSWNEIYMFDATTQCFIEVSDGLCIHLGYQKSALVALTPLDILGDYTEETFRTLLEPLLSGKQKQIGLETSHFRQDGSSYPVEISLQVTRQDDRTTCIVIAQDITNRKRFIEELEHKSLHDQLTGLPNRILVVDRLACALNEARRNCKPVAALMVKALHLREINDLLGHNSGDQVLLETSATLGRLLRESDTLGRMGSNEFAIILPDTNASQASLVARKIHQSFQLPILVGDIEVEIETGIGIALFPDHSGQAQPLLQYADIAMQIARHEPGGIKLYHADSDPYCKRRLRLHGELRKTIAEGQLVLHYQPKVDMKTGRIIGAEALARWPHPLEGLIPPCDFIPLIEQTGLVKPFTEWALETAISQARDWQTLGYKVPVSVNLSTRNLIDPDLPILISALLKRYGLDTDGLILELTESTIMDRPEQSIKSLGELADMGLKLSIDDFGTGYSSLAYLKHLPVAELKIDRSFVSQICADKNDAMIVRATIDLAHNLGLTVVAEGIEDQETQALLCDFACDLAQGYHFGKPVPADQFPLHLTAENTDEPPQSEAANHY